MLLSQLQRLIFGYLLELTTVAAGFGRLEGVDVVVAVHFAVLHFDLRFEESPGELITRFDDEQRGR